MSKKNSNKLMHLPGCRNHDFCGLNYDFLESDKS